ncbi:MAG: methyltransferase domain-containing protein [Actinomycetota bacterium]|nr:methyltransferase domain-containing protein [Actinomycetota bacterium]
MRTVDGEPFFLPTSLSTGPGLMARMLELLDVRDGHRVLEIGTGTGYNAALLCHRLGADSVVSIDIDPDLVDQARQRLAAIGYEPALVAGDGEVGVPDMAPYDRVIATAVVPAVPLAWMDQLAPDGVIVVNIRGELCTGPVCVLTKTRGERRLTGRFPQLGGHFMWSRPLPDNPLRPHEYRPVRRSTDVSEGRTTLDPTGIIDDQAIRFLLQLRLHGAESFYRFGDTVTVLASDSSRADVDGGGVVRQSGPRRLWDTVEVTERLYTELRRPPLDHYSITVTPSEQYISLGDRHRWPLPLV